MDNLKELIIDQNNPLLNHIKWNDLVDSNIKFNQIISSMLGPNYKGFYDSEKHYDLYDYVWKDSDLFMVHDEDSSIHFKLDTTVKKAFPISKNHFIGINENEKLVEVINNASVQLTNYPIDDFAYNHSNKYIVAKYKNRLYKISNNETTGLNLLFDTNIKSMELDDFYLYLLTDDNRIIYGEINSTDNTLYEEVQLPEECISFSINDINIVALGISETLFLINKQTKEVTSYDLVNIIKDVAKSKIIVPNNQYIIIYDGIDSLYSYYKDDTSTHIGKPITLKIKDIDSFKYNNDILLYSNSQANIMLSNFLQPLKYIDIHTLLVKNSYINAHISYGLDFTQNQYEDYELKVQSKNDIDFQLNKGAKFKTKTSQMTLQTPELSNRTIMFDIPDIESSLELDIILEHNSKKYIYEFRREESFPKCKIFAEIENDKVTWYVYNIFNKIEIISNGRIEEEGNNKIITIKGKNFSLNSISIFHFKLGKEQMDYMTNNKLLFGIGPYKDGTPYAPVKSDENGFVDIQRGTDGVKGILRISDDVNTPATDKAFSTIGAKKHLDAIKTINKRIDNDVSQINHTHKFEEILETPIASTKNSGIVQLSSDISKTNDKAATPGAVQKAYDKANHEHPYLNIKDGGTVVGPTVFYEASFDKISANGEIKINKIDGINTLVFQDDSKNGGYIKHKQENSKGIIYFSSGTIRDNINGFSFGYSVGNKYTETAFLSSSGILTVDTLNTKNVVISGYVVTIG